MDIYDSVDSIKNVGAKRKELLNKIGIFSVKDLIEYIPRDYLDRSDVKTLGSIDEPGEYTIKARVTGRVETYIKGRLKITRTIVSDAEGEALVIWFNQPYLKSFFDKSKEYFFTGRFEKNSGRLVLSSPEFEEVKEESLNNGRIIPKYHLTKSLNQKLLRKLIYDTLKECKSLVTEFIPDNIRHEFNLAERMYSLENIHFPESREAFFAARRRLVFEELFLLSLRLLMVKGEIKRQKTGIAFSFFETDGIKEKLPFELTSGQEEVLDDIISDMKEEYPMNRLIQGDVGSGKTAVSEICAYIAYINGVQTAVMAPTDVLATQHYYTFSGLFGKVGAKVVLLKSSMTAAEKRNAKEMIRDGYAHIVIGTHALIQKTVEFKELGLVITDEQHRFGVNQRRLIASKGKNPHTLVMTATPIPRTLGLILYGDLDISTIRTMPSGRQEINTSFVDPSYRERIYRFILKNVKEGRQAYIVCPMIDESEKAELKAVMKYVNDLKQSCLKDVRLGFVHGKMKPYEKQGVMDGFSAGEIDVLVATTVIEVGINVPNANIMLIENAERYGLSQLHQLRGRVGRGSHKSYCILVSDVKKGKTAERLKVMVRCSDGFELSEKDLSLRGPGDFFGIRQHGLPDFKIANLYKDMDILKEAQNLSRRIYDEDRLFKAEKYKMIYERVREAYGEEGEGVTF